MLGYNLIGFSGKRVIYSEEESGPNTEFFEGSVDALSLMFHGSLYRASRQLINAWWFQLNHSSMTYIEIERNKR